MEYIPTPREVKKANYKIKCEYCGTIFFANKCTAKFCSTLCRVKYNKEHPGEQRKYVKKEDNNVSQSVADEKPKEAPQSKKSDPKVKTTTKKKKVQEKQKKAPKQSFHEFISSLYLQTLTFEKRKPLNIQNGYNLLPKIFKDYIEELHAKKTTNTEHKEIMFEGRKYWITAIPISTDSNLDFISIKLVVS